MGSEINDKILEFIAKKIRNGDIPVKSKDELKQNDYIEQYSKLLSELFKKTDDTSEDITPDDKNVDILEPLGDLLSPTAKVDKTDIEPGAPVDILESLKGLVKIPSAEVTEESTIPEESQVTQVDILGSLQELLTPTTEVEEESTEEENPGVPVDILGSLQELLKPTSEVVEESTEKEPSVAQVDILGRLQELFKISDISQTVENEEPKNVDVLKSLQELTTPIGEQPILQIDILSALRKLFEGSSEKLTSSEGVPTDITQPITEQLTPTVVKLSAIDQVQPVDTATDQGKTDTATDQGKTDTAIDSTTATVQPVDTATDQPQGESSNQPYVLLKSYENGSETWSKTLKIVDGKIV
jgi:hypothetical protein